MPEISSIIDRIVADRGKKPAAESLLVAVSGIDASGKGYCSRLIVEALQGRGLNAVGIGLDPWMNHRSIRLVEENPGENFYRNGFRFDLLFDELVLPLKKTRSVQLDAKLLTETATEYHDHRYDFENVDVIVLEGVFLFQPRLRSHYDLAIWVECSFETAIERAIVRGQEGLPPDETVRAFETIYFPAEEFHFALDNPKASTDLVLMNDPRLESNETI
jgi:uridine kinase